MTQLVGRLHPLLVHLPIGILLLAAAFEWLSYYKTYRKLRTSVRAMVLFGALASTLSVVTGWLLAEAGGYEERLVELHRNSGIATAVFAWIIFFARDSIITLFREKKKRKLVRIFLFIPLTALLALTGHLGGSLTHGEDYLSGGGTGTTSGTVRIAWTGHPDSAQVYNDVIAPILDTRCYSCHGPTKQKGQLRLDEPSFINAGGKHGEVLDRAAPDSSELYMRLLLPMEDEHHMPPNEKAQLTSAEIALIHGWIAAGAPFDKRISELDNATAMRRYLETLLQPAVRKPLLPELAVAPAPGPAVAALRNLGVIVLPVSDSTHYLSVSYVNARSVTDDQLALLLPLREQVLWLDLTRTSVGNSAMKFVSQLPVLTQLNLQFTQIGDDGLKGIVALSRLESLNVVATKMSDKGLEELSTLKSLKRVYCYGTDVTRSGVEKLLRLNPKIAIDTGGYQLPPRVTDTLVYKPLKKN